jgi:small-conductance mechanosensitive channel
MLDNRLVSALRGPARWWALLFSLIFALRFLERGLAPKPVAHGIGIAVLIILLYSLTLTASRLLIVFIDHRLQQHASGQEVTTIVANAIRFVVSIPAVLVLLHVFDVNLAPALTALGVGGIAVSLALQGTLSDLFSGFYVSMAGMIHNGDYVKLDLGREGWVEDIRWRVTTLRTGANNLIIVPNSKLAGAVVENFSFPAKPFSVTIPIGVSYSTDIDHLEKVVLEEALASVGEVEGLLKDPQPVVRFNPGFGDSSLNFTLVVQVREYQHQFAITDHIRRRLFKRFQKEKIQIPFPVRTLDVPPGTLARALSQAAEQSEGGTPTNP